jgi:MFS family permease
METEKFNTLQVGGAMGIFAVGLFLFGIFCNFLVQRFRRNKVCVFSILLMALCLSALYYMHGLKSQYVEVRMVLLQRLLLGATFGLAQMVLCSTLIIDASESFRRTEANHSSAWFSRMALSIGPMTGIVLFNYMGFDSVLLASMLCAVSAATLILTVRIPFRTPPDSIPLFSCDRFFLPQGLVLMVNLLFFSFTIGLLLSLGLTDRFYAIMMVGFLLALLAQRFVFRDAELKSEVVSGLIVLLAALLMIYTRPLPVVWFIAPVFIGFSVGIVCSRFLLFFVKLSRHCQRGTSQSTFILGWESGLALGIGAGYALFDDVDPMLLLAMGATVLTLLMYNGYTHRWFIANKNR